MSEGVKTLANSPFQAQMLFTLLLSPAWLTFAYLCSVSSHNHGMNKIQRERLLNDGCAKISQEPELWECADGRRVKLKEGKVSAVNRLQVGGTGIPK